MRKDLNNYFLLSLDMQARLMTLLKTFSLFGKPLKNSSDYLLMTLVVIIYNNCNHTTQFWNEILSNWLLHGDILMPSAIVVFSAFGLTGLHKTLQIVIFFTEINR